MSYSDKLKDPRWQKKRLEIFQRDNFKCLKCGDAEETLCVHHLKYVKEPWDCPNEFLETLCETCHDWRTRFDDFWGERELIPTEAIGYLFRLIEIKPPSLSDPNSQLRRIMLRDILLKRASDKEFALSSGFFKRHPEVNPTTLTISSSPESTCESRSGNQSEGQALTAPDEKKHIAAAESGVTPGAGVA